MEGPGFQLRHVLIFQISHVANTTSSCNLGFPVCISHSFLVDFFPCCLPSPKTCWESIWLATCQGCLLHSACWDMISLETFTGSVCLNGKDLLCNPKFNISSQLHCNCSPKIACHCQSLFTKNNLKEFLQMSFWLFYFTLLYSNVGISV